MRYSTPYLETLARAAYLWAWPMVNIHNRREAFRRVPGHGLINGVMPAAPLNRLTMLTDYIEPSERFIACPNQDVAYGFGILSLDASPVVIQVPDMGDRFWVYQIGDQRTDGNGGLGSMYGSKAGHYLVVGPTWDGEAPEGIVDVIRSTTDLSYCIPRLFLDDSDEDRAAIQPLLRRISAYPVEEYEGSERETVWTGLPSFPGPATSGGEEIRWVDPATFFDVLPAILQEVPPRPGEEALHRWFGDLVAAAADPGTRELLDRVAAAADKEVVGGLFDWRFVGEAVGNGWTSPHNGAAFGTDYLTRTAVAKTNIFVNQPNETKYFYNQRDVAGEQLTGSRSYRVTFPAGGLPPVRGFWSLTLYDQHHFFAPNDLRRYSLGTKNRDLAPDPDGGLTLTVSATRPTETPASNWLPAPDGDPFSLYLRAYWPDDAVLSGSWVPPVIERVG